MRGMLVINKKKRQAIINYYKEANVEKMLVVFLKKEGNKYKADEIIKPSRQDYKYITRNYTSLKSRALKGCIEECINNVYDGILLVHNHRKGLIPLMSTNDRKANRQILNYIKNNTSITFGSGVYASKRLTYILEDKLTIAQKI